MDFIGKYCVIRSDRAGVFAGTVIEHKDQQVLLGNARRIWYWSGAASISQLASEGVKNPNACKFSMPVDSLALFDVIEIIPTTEIARDNIESVKIWKI